MTVESRYLAVGDKICLSPGDILPADCILAQGEVSIDQSMLTGETLPVVKTEGGHVYMGSICKKGEIEAFVTAIGKSTYFCKGITMTQEINNNRGKVEQVLAKIAFLLTIVSSVLVTIVFIVLLDKGNEFLESLAVSALLMVISLPIAMQVVCATTLAVGAKALYNEKTLVCKLNAIEELAGMEILCINKSGFLTKKKPVVGTPILFESKSINDLFLFALLSSRREKESQNPIDRTICTYGLITLQLTTHMYEEEDFIPFSPKRKHTFCTVRNVITGEITKCCKGSVQVILAITKNWALESSISEIVLELASKGYSAVAVARTDKQYQWEFLGLIPILYPISTGASSSLRTLSELNVSITMLSGDYLAVSKKYFMDLHLGDRIFNAEILNSDNTTLQQEFIDSILMYANGYAEVYPEHKFTLVKMLQRKGKRVGITGRAISDAPALKIADVGLAAYGATDAAMASSDIIYQKSGLKTVANSIVSARKIFQRAETYCIFRIACSFQLLLFVFVGVVAVDPSGYHCTGNSKCQIRPNTSTLPVLTLVIIALLNDGNIIAIAYDTAPGRKYPCKWDLKAIFIVACVLGAIALLSSVAFLLIGLNHMSPDNPSVLFTSLGIEVFNYGEILNAIFLKVSISNYLTIFSVRCRGSFAMNLPGKAVFSMGFVSMAVSTLLSKYWFLNLQPKNSVIIANLSPLPWRMVILIWVYDFFVFLAQDIVKIAIYKAFAIYKIKSQDKVLINMMLSEATYFQHQNTTSHLLTQRAKIAASC